MKKTIRNTTIADRILFLLLIISSAAGLFYTREAFSLGHDVVIEVSGNPVYTLSLDANREISIEGTHGRTVLEIRNGKVRMKEADCSNQLCIKQGWISRGTIVCLPNSIVVIIGRGTKQDIDAVTG